MYVIYADERKRCVKYRRCLIYRAKHYAIQSHYPIALYIAACLRQWGTRLTYGYLDGPATLLCHVISIKRRRTLIRIGQASSVWLHRLIERRDWSIVITVIYLIAPFLHLLIHWPILQINISTLLPNKSYRWPELTLATKKCVEMPSTQRSSLHQALPSPMTERSSPKM